MEIRAADAVNDPALATAEGFPKGVPYPVQDEVEHIASNKLAVESAAEEERQRRIDEMHSRECESAIVREINIEYAIAAMETERIRRISQHNLAQVHNEMFRENSKKEVVKLMEEERGRRMSQENLALVHDEILRERSKQLVVAQMEKERSRRMSEGHIAQVHNELLREQSKRAVVHAAEAERTRRLSQGSIAEVHENLMRRDSIDKVVQLAEGERARRIQEELKQHHENKLSRQEQQALAVGAMEGERLRRMSSSDHEQIIASMTALPPDDGEGTAASPSEELINYPELPIASSNEETEKKGLYDLRALLKDVLPLAKDKEENSLRDIRLIRFLRGHKGNVETAAAKYRESLALRAKYQLDEIRDNIILGNMTVQDFPYYEKIKRYIPAVFAHDVHDDHHNVFYFEKLGAVDLYGLVVNVTEEEWLSFCLHELEFRELTLDKLSLQHETLVRCTTIRDLDGFSVTRITRQVLQRMQRIISLGSLCYPETISKVVFTNTPWAFHTAWRGVQIWLNDAQRQKVCFLKRGDNEALHAICPPENLPSLMGGTNDQAVIPATGLLGKDSYALLRENGATEAEIRARDTLTIPFRVNANDTLCWEFCVLNYDVDFSVKFRTQGEGGAVELNVEGWEKARFVHGQVESASWTAPSAGAAILCWDNSFSWTRPKTICYKASVAKTLQVDESEQMDISGHGSL